MAFAVTSGPHVLDSAAAAAAGEDRTGGKASGLARLASSGVRVPWWVVLPTEAFAAHLAAAGLDRKIRDALDGLTRERAGEVGTALSRVVAAAPLDPALAASLRETIAGRGPLAVRSSVVGEDSAAGSHAGLFDSFLFLETPEAVLDAVVRCWSSAFNPRALVYAIDRGGAVTPPAMGVIVQEAVRGEASGVLFTANPVSGRHDEALISACWGLGEGLVDGRCDADELVYGHDGRERSATVAVKAVQILPADGGGTREAEVEPGRRKVRSLEAGDAHRLVAAGLRIAGAGLPQDIEWTLAGGELVFLQARPVTALPPSPLGQARIVWDNSNIQESFNGVTTPLTFSVARRAYASIYTQSLRVLGVRGDQPAARNLLGLVDGRVYYNIDNWYRLLLALPGFDRNKADMERMMGVQEPVDFVADVALTRRQKLRRLPAMARVLVRLAREFRRIDASVERFMAGFERELDAIGSERVDHAGYGELIALAERVHRDIVGRWVAPILNDTFVMMTAGRLSRLVGDEELVTGLMSGEEALASAEPTRQLAAIARAIAADPALRAILGEPDAWESLRARSPALRAGLDAYLATYGDRCIGEMKLESLSLRQDPSFLVGVLRNFVQHAPDLDALESREAARREALWQRAAADLGPWRRRRLRRALTDLRRGVAARERMRLARTRFVGLLREIYTAAGLRLHEAGVLADPRDVFLLTGEELLGLCDGTGVTAELAGLARLRRAEYAGYERGEPPHHFVTIGPPPFGERSAPRREVVGDDPWLLRGTGCSPGVAEAPVHVVLRPDDDLAVAGRILTTRRTDPGWAPLFPSAAGLLIERGSTLSHSAVLAREFGIPCVVGVPDLLTRVRHGERVRLDGASGIVERLDAS